MTGLDMDAIAIVSGASALTIAAISFVVRKIRRRSLTVLEQAERRLMKVMALRDDDGNRSPEMLEGIAEEFDEIAAALIRRGDIERATNPAYTAAWLREMAHERRKRRAREALIKGMLT